MSAIAQPTSEAGRPHVLAYPQRARRGLRLPLAAVVATVLALGACASWMGPRTVEVSSQDMLARLDTKFPLHKQVLGIFDITATHPQLTPMPEENRLTAQVDLVLQDQLFHKAHVGYVRASFGLRYDPADLTVRLDQVRLEDLSLPTLAPDLQDSLRHLGNQLAREALQGYAIKQFKPEDLRGADRLGYQVQDLRVTASGLAVDLVPKSDATASR